MPTCIEKLCNHHSHCKEVRHPKCCLKNSPICRPRIVEQHLECCDCKNCCHAQSCTESNTKLDPDFKCKNSKPLNVRLKLQLVNDGISKNTGCLCAKYFEMLDACYGGSNPEYGQRSSPRQGPCMPQAPQFPYMPQAPHFYKTPVPFPLNYQPIMPEMGNNPAMPANELCKGTCNAKIQDDCKGSCNSPRIQPSIKFRENDTQTDKNDYNKCMIACEDYVEKLLSTRDTSRRCDLKKNENRVYNTVSCTHIETLNHINAALAGITGTLQEIQKTLQHQQIDNYHCNKEAQLLQQQQKLYQQIDNCRCDQEAQLLQHKTKLKPSQIDNCLCNEELRMPQQPKKLISQQINNCLCNDEPRMPQQPKKLIPQQIDNCLCDDTPRIRLEEHGCYCGDETEMRNTHYSSKQTCYDQPKTLQYSEVSSGKVPAGYISSASGRLIPYTNVLNVTGPQKLNTPVFWPFIPKSMPPPPPPLPPPFRILPWDDLSELKSTHGNTFNHQKFKCESPKITQPFSNTSAAFNPVVSSPFTFPGFSTSTISKTASNGTGLPPAPFETTPQSSFTNTLQGIDSQSISFGTNISSSKLGAASLHGTSLSHVPFTEHGLISSPHTHGATVLTTPSHGTVSPSVAYRTSQQSSSSVPRPVVSPLTFLQGKHEKVSHSFSWLPGTSAVPQPPPLPLPPIAENTVLSNNGKTKNLMSNSYSKSTSAHMSFMDELKSKSRLRSDLNTALPPKQVKTASSKSISHGKFAAELKTAVERRKAQGSKSKESRLPVCRRVVYTSPIGRRFHDAMKHRMKNIRKDTAPSDSGSEKSNFDDHNSN